MVITCICIKFQSVYFSSRISGAFLFFPLPKSKILWYNIGIWTFSVPFKELFMYSKQISDYIESQKDNMLKDIARLIAIPSVRGQATPDYPFGEMPAKALFEFLAIANEHGFKTTNIQNAIGFADLNDGELELGMLAHADVVPEGDGWTWDPYTMTIDGDNIVGRGTSDNKGPMIAALYAMKAVKDLNIPDSKNVRLIVGSDEECGSGDLPYYFNNYESPKYSFSPDAEFPLINIEKGRFAPKFCAEIANDDNIVSIESGIAVNAVPHLAKVELKNVCECKVKSACEKVSASTGVTFDISSGDVVTVIANGKAAHASLPHGGNNALTAMLEMLSSLELDSKLAKLLLSLSKLFPHGDYYGKAMGVARSDEMSGDLTMSLDIMKYDGNTLTANIDCRMAVSATQENTVDPTIENLKSAGFDVDPVNVVAPHYVDPELPFVKTLLSVYEKHTGLKGECIAIGGGTYVHDIENGVAFGCIMPDFDTHMHGADEFMPIDDLITSAKIFADAIVQICN